tara:strand:- start:16 stop:243 length:228 start_codon:yes stop_codon:yes gene_type:complete
MYIWTKKMDSIRECEIKPHVIVYNDVDENGCNIQKITFCFGNIGYIDPSKWFVTIDNDDDCKPICGTYNMCYKSD